MSICERACVRGNPGVVVARCRRRGALVVRRARARSTLQTAFLALRLACARSGGARRVLLRVRHWGFDRWRATTVLRAWRGLAMQRRRRAQVRCGLTYVQ